MVTTAELDEVDISKDGHPRSILVAKHLSGEFQKELTQMLQEYRDVFVWSYKEIKASVRSFISIRLTSRHMRYRSNKDVTG